MRKKYLTARVPDDVEQDILTIAEERHWSKSKTAALILEDWIDKWHKGEVEI